MLPIIPSPTIMVSRAWPPVSTNLNKEKERKISTSRSRKNNMVYIVFIVVFVDRSPSVVFRKGDKKEGRIEMQPVTKTKLL